MSQIDSNNIVPQTFSKQKKQCHRCFDSDAQDLKSDGKGSSAPNHQETIVQRKHKNRVP